MRCENNHICNERLLYLQSLPQGLFIGGAAAFVDVFLVRLGAESWLVSLSSSLASLLMMLAVLPVGAWVQRRGRYLRDLIASRWIHRIIFGLMALVPFLGQTLASYALVGLRASASLPASMQNVTFTTVLGQATARNRRARMLSTRLAAMRLSMALVGFLTGLWLDRVLFPLNYQVLFATSLLAGAGTTYLLAKLRLPEEPEEVESPERPRLDLRQIPELLKSAPRFQRYITARMLVQVGVSLGIGLLPFYRVRNLGASDAWLGVLLTVQHITQVVSYLVLSRLLRKRGFRRKLWVATLGMALMPITTALAPGPEWLVLPSLIIGVFGAALMVYFGDSVIAYSPEDRRPFFAAINSFVLQGINFVGPLVGSALAAATSVQAILLLAGALRLIGGLAFWWLTVRQPKQPAT